MPDIALTLPNATGLPAPPPRQPDVPDIGAYAPTSAMQPDTLTRVVTGGVLEQYRDLGNQGVPTAASSDMMLTGAPVARRDGHVIELTTYQRPGKFRWTETP